MGLKNPGRVECRRVDSNSTWATIIKTDRNCKNLSIDNYEFLCHECYVKSGTSGFSGHSMTKIN